MNGPESPDVPAESNSTQEQPPQPVKKPAKRKLKRAYSRTLKRGAKDQKNPNASPDPPPSPPAVSSESLVVQRTATTQGAARNASKTELQRELKSVLEQNALLQSQLDAATKKLQSSESKREATSASLHSYQSKFRDSQKRLKQAESMVDRQAKQLSISTEDTDLIVQQKMEQLKSKHKVSCVTCFISNSNWILTHNPFLLDCIWQGYWARAEEGCSHNWIVEPEAW